MVSREASGNHREALRYVTKMEGTRTLIDLGSEMVIDALSSEGFYVSCPIFLFLRAEAREAVRITSQTKCPECVRSKAWNPLVNRFVSHILLQHELCSLVLQSTAVWFVNRSDADPEQRCFVKMRVRYNEGGQVKSILF